MSSAFERSIAGAIRLLGEVLSDAAEIEDLRKRAEFAEAERAQWQANAMQLDRAAASERDRANDLAGKLGEYAAELESKDAVITQLQEDLGRAQDVAMNLQEVVRNRENGRHTVAAALRHERDACREQIRRLGHILSQPDSPENWARLRSELGNG